MKIFDMHCDTLLEMYLKKKDLAELDGHINLEKLRSEYERLISEKDTATERLLRAFPKFHSHNYSESLQLLRDKMLYKGHRHSSDEAENQPEMIEESKEESKV